nr:MAG: nucleotide binding protein [Tomato vitivirus 1]UTQ50745.1 MAG: nucleotide binding protein [Tomato vitivirus 1]
MDDPSLLTGKSTMAKRRRQKKLGICRCGAFHNEINCRKKPISLTKIKRLEFVQVGRVAIESETPQGLLPGLVVMAYPQIKFNIPARDNSGVVAPRHPARSPEETPEFYVW